MSWGRGTSDKVGKSDISSQQAHNLWHLLAFVSWVKEDEALEQQSTGSRGVVGRRAGQMGRWGNDQLTKDKTGRPTCLYENVYTGEDGEKRFVPVWHNIIIVLGESMSRRGEMVF